MDDPAIEGMVNHEVILDDFDDDEVFVPAPEPPLERQLLHIDDPLVWPMNDDSDNASCRSKGFTTIGDVECERNDIGSFGTDEIETSDHGDVTEGERIDTAELLLAADSHAVSVGKTNTSRLMMMRLSD